jgi:hypothetical protein
MSKLEDDLALQIKFAGLPEPIREFRAIPERRFKWDFAWGKLLIEVQGGTWRPRGNDSYKSGHNTGAGIARDAQKNNIAVLAGYRVLYFTSDMIRSGEALGTLREALGEQLWQK